MNLLVKQFGRAILPKPYQAPLYKSYQKLRYFGLRHYCPICQSHLRQFLPFRRRLNAFCPICGSLERHRLSWLFILQRTDLFSPRRKKMLHVAPETCLTKLFQTSPSIDYITADLKPNTRLQMDLTKIPFPKETFDVIHASHILEHIPADRQAMRELFRVLKRGGWAVLQVPINAEITFEDATIIDPQAREQAFGHKNHVRLYGKDYYSRLSEAGFTVKPEKLPTQLNPATIRKFGLNPHEAIAFCTKL